jgi:hypothetical protein
MTDEDLGAFFPGTFERKRPAVLARHGQRAQSGGAQVLVERADRMIGDDVEGTCDRKRRNRRPAGQSLELHDAEGVGQAREYEDVGGSDMRGQVLARLLAEEFRVREAALELGARRAVADHDLGAGQIEREESFEILLDRNAADRGKDRPRKVELRRLVRIE